MLRWFVPLALALATIVGIAILTLDWNPGFAYPAVVMDRSMSPPQGDFYRGAYLEVTDTNPFTTIESTSLRYVLRFTHEPLLDIDPESDDLRPALASSHTLSEDGLVAEFVLREGLIFADGSALTMGDVEFTMAIGRNLDAGDSIQKQVMQTIEEFEVLDERRFKIILKKRHYAGILRVATNLRIVAKKFFMEEVARLARSEQIPVPDNPRSPKFLELCQRVRRAGPATGPYKIGRDADGNPAWYQGHSLTLVQNPHNWRRTQGVSGWNLAGIHLRFVTDAAAQRSALMNGEIDWFTPQTESLQSLLDNHPRIAADFNLHNYDAAHNGPYLVLWNHRREGLGDAKVRRALTMLFDRKTIVEKLLNGAARIPNSWFKPGTPEVPAGLEPLPFDPQAAKALLRQAGYGPENPLKLKLITVSGWTFARRVLELAKETFRKADVHLDVQTMPFPNLHKKLAEEDFDCALYLRSLRLPIDPTPDFHSKDNPMGYTSDEIDRILSAASQELDVDRRIDLYREFSRIFHFDQPVTLLAFPLTQVLLHKRFQNVQIGPLGLSPERWWVKLEDQLIK